MNSLGLSATDEEFYKEKKNYNSVLNLQLLEESKNKSKGDDALNDWAKANGKNNVDLYINASTSLDILDFKDFVADRKSVLLDKMKTILSV